MQQVGEVPVRCRPPTHAPSPVGDLRPDKNADAAFIEAEELRKRLDPHAYGPPTIRFNESDVDQARAAGVLIEFDRGAPIITDRSLYRELAKQAVARTVEELRSKSEQRAVGRAAARNTTR